MRAILLALAAAFALQLPSAQAPPAFRASTDVVEVDVVVHDKSGAFVRDLSIGDFVVEDSGRPVSIDQIYLHLMSTPEWRDADRTGSFVPRVEQGNARRTMIAVFDSDHLTTGGFKRTRDGVVHLFDRQFLDGVDLGGVVVDGRIVGNRLTSSREELLKILKDSSPAPTKSSRLLDERQWPRMSDVEAVRIRVNNDGELRESVIQRAMQDDPTVRRDYAESAVDIKVSDLSSSAQAQTNRTLQTLMALFNGLERIPGRKTVVLLTEGFLADESWPLVKDAIARAARGDTRVYTLDARGLDRNFRSGSDVAPGTMDAMQRMLEQLDFGGDAMNSLAVDTGGFVVRNTNDFARAIDRIADDASNYYVLAFRPAVADGKYHKLSVRVNRRDVAVRARRGYIAAPRSAAVATEALKPTGAPRTEAATPETAAASELVPAPSAPASAPAAPASASASSEATVTKVAPAQGLRFRPDATKHVDLLLKNDAADAAAQAGWAAYEHGDVATARTSLALAASSPSAHAWVHYALGLSEYALREFKESAASWETVRRMEPLFEPVYFDLVDSYLQLREHDEAAAVLRAARDRWPKDPDVFNALGVVQTSRGTIDDAVKSFQTAVSLAPQDGVGQYNLGRALEMRYMRTRRYVQQLQRWVSNERDRADAVEHYKACIAIGGAFSAQAQDALTRLNWQVKP
jgi:VWFA-related protein